MKLSLTLPCLILLGLLPNGFGDDKIAGSPITNEGVFPGADVLFPDGKYLQWARDDNPEADQILKSGTIPFTGEFPLDFSFVTEVPEKNQIDVTVFENPEAAKAKFGMGKNFITINPNREMADEQSGTNWEWWLEKYTLPSGNVREMIEGRVENITYRLLDSSGPPDRKRLLASEENYRRFLLEKLEGSRPSDKTEHQNRDWTNAGGKSIEAALLKHYPETGTIDLKRSDGKVYRSLPLKTFSQSDQDYVKQLGSN